MNKGTRPLFIASLFLFLLSNYPASAMTLNSPGVLVKFKEGTTLKDKENILKQNGATLEKKIDQLGIQIINVSKGNKDAVITALSKNPKVEYAEPDYVAEALIAPNDPFYASNQWGFENTKQTIVGVVGTEDADIDAEQAWSKTLGGVKVAVLDTGVDQDHPDLSAQIVSNTNFTDSPTVDDIYGHGTHVSGIIAAITNNGIGVAGGCPNCKIMNVKVLNDSGSGAYSWIISGIIYAADNGAKVINMSLGSSSKSRSLENAVNYAWSKGVVVVAAAGNSNNPSLTYPAAYTKAIAVAATNNKDQRAYFSSYGNKWVDVAAPGENIFSTFPNHDFVIGTNNRRSKNYDYASGTSMSTPMVSATTALIWSSSYGTSATAVRARLESTADKISGTGKYWSAGRINAGSALK